MAGYSPTPLVRKLGIKSNDIVLLINGPDHFDQLIGDWSENVKKVSSEESNDINFIILFTQEMAELETMFPQLKARLKKGGSLWISWPKGSSRLDKDLNGNDVRRIGLQNGLVDVKVCAIDEDWSGLKFMFRTKGKN